MILQQLLTEVGSGGNDQDLVSVDAGRVEAAADWDSLWFPENYLGYERTENFASPDGAVLGARQVDAVPAQLRLNHWAVAGDLTVNRQSRFRSASRRSRARSSLPRAAGSRRSTPASPTSTRPTGAATSPPGKSGSTSPPRYGLHSAHCADDATLLRRNTPFVVARGTTKAKLASLRKELRDGADTRP